MKIRILCVVLTVFALLICTAAAQKQIRPRAIGDFDSCIQSTDCVYQCFYNSVDGNYNLTTTSGGIQSGVGIISANADSFILTDNTKDYRFKIISDNETGYSTVIYRAGATTIAFSNYRNLTCSCQ